MLDLQSLQIVQTCCRMDYKSSTSSQDKGESNTIISQLHVAVMRGFIEVIYHITRLLPHQAFLDLANHTGRTALHLAVGAGDAGVARHLVVCGASPVSRDRRGNTPLHLACGQGDALMVTQLTRPVTVAEVINARLSYAPAHTAGLLAADLTNYDGECSQWLFVLSIPGYSSMH
nr:NF-kappa-B inhibitor cactus-like [Cherax quadricarinatus]